MNQLTNDEVIYCPHCGSANKKSAVRCIECSRKMNTAYHPFYDFLKKHTAEDVSGQVTDTLFSLLKKFLMSHLYGVAISVSVIATAVAVVGATEPHVEKITAPILVTKTEEAPQETAALTDDDLYAFEHLISNYDGFVDELRSSYGYWEESNQYGSATELYAENNIEGFGYAGAHEMISSPIDMHMLDEDPLYADVEFESHHYYVDRYLDKASVAVGGACTSEFAKLLQADGYQVAEGNYVLWTNVGEYDFDTHVGTGFYKKLVYKVVFVAHEGKWYIAEDRLVERTNV